jgi:hypothetical protein
MLGRMKKYMPRPIKSILLLDQTQKIQFYRVRKDDSNHAAMRPNTQNNKQKQLQQR